MKIEIRIKRNESLNPMTWWNWQRQWIRRLYLLRVRPKQRPGVMTAKEVLKKVQLKPAEREAVQKALPDMGAPDKLPDGARYDAAHGCTVYADSESIVPYLGSEQEAEDADKPRLPRRKPKLSKADRVTCPHCLGWGDFGSDAFPCPKCGGHGRT